MDIKKRNNINIFKNNFFKSFILYCFSFIIISGFICSIFLKYNMSFVWTKLDGLNQHLITLNYFKRVLTNFFLGHGLNTFTWNIGFGMDMFANLAYYSFGDIFSYFSLLVSYDKLKYLYSLLVPMRMFFVGLSFLFYCRYKKIYNTTGVIGSLMYTFCTFALFSSVRHPYFINAMIVFPITMIGIEKSVNDDKFIFFIFSVFLMFFSSFYFGYMNAIVIAIYGFVLCLLKYKTDYIMLLKRLFLIFLCALLGIVMDFVFLLPTIFSFLSSSRASVIGNISYNISYYRSLFSSLTTATTIDRWSIIGISPLILLTLPLFIKNRRKYISMFILMIVLILPLIFSSLSYVMSGMSYPCNRYVYMLMFVFSFISVLVLNEKIEITFSLMKRYLCFMVLYLVLLVFFQTGINVCLIVAIISFYCFIKIIFEKNNFCLRGNSYYLYLINFVVIIGLLFNCYYLYDVDYINYVSEFAQNYDIDNIYNTVNWSISSFDDALDYIRTIDRDYYLIAKSTDDLWNLGLIKNYNSISYFYSINSSLYQKISDDLNNSESSGNFEIKEFDNRTKITSLLGVKYFVTDSDNVNMYGYDKIKKINNTYIYRNNNMISFASYYNRCINKKLFNKLSSLEKEDALLRYYITDVCENKTVEFNDISNIQYNSSVDLDESISINNISGNSVNLQLDGKIQGELFLEIDNIKYEDFSLDDYIKFNNYNRDIDIARYKLSKRWASKDLGFTITASTDSYSNSETIYDDSYIYYRGNDDVLINLGYYDDYDGNISIDFSKYGKYSFDNLKILQVSFDDYENNVKDLNSSNFSLIDYGDNYIKGSINVSEEGIIKFSTLYNRGWKVMVDGKPVNTFNDEYFLAINVDSGYHEINLEYETPFLKVGFYSSLIGWIIFVILVFLRRIFGFKEVIKNG